MLWVLVIELNHSDVSDGVKYIKTPTSFFMMFCYSGDKIPT